MFRLIPKSLTKLIIRNCTIVPLSKNAQCMTKLAESFKQDADNNLVVPVFKKALLYSDSIATKDTVGEYSYYQLYISAKKLSIQISNICGSASLTTVAFLCPNNSLWLMVLWACWMSGQIASPLDDANQTVEQLKSYLEDSKTKLLISTQEYKNTTDSLTKQADYALLVVEHSFIPTSEDAKSQISKQFVHTDSSIVMEGILPNDFYTNAKAVQFFTASKNQKNIILTHRDIEKQIETLISAWNLSTSDCALYYIQLNRIISMINALLTVGGSVVMHQQFDCHNAWSSVLSKNNAANQRVNILLAMPSTYKQLTAEYDKIFAKDTLMVDYIINHCKTKFRLMLSGFSPLSDSLRDYWYKITGHNLLDYYATKENGFVLLQNQNDIAYNVPDTLGLPLQNINVRLIDNDKNSLICRQGGNVEMYTKHFSSNTAGFNPIPATIQGELQIHMPTVNFQNENDEQFAAKALDDGFHSTGDIFCHRKAGFKFLGKSSNVVTVGGYKIYTSEIKSILMAHPDVKDAVIVGIPDKIWGERLCAICIVNSDKTERLLDSLKSFCANQLPHYKRPTIFKTIVK